MTEEELERAAQISALESIAAEAHLREFLINLLEVVQTLCAEEIFFQEESEFWKEFSFEKLERRRALREIGFRAGEAMLFLGLPINLEDERLAWGIQLRGPGSS